MTPAAAVTSNNTKSDDAKSQEALLYDRQVQKLSLENAYKKEELSDNAAAVEARFITHQDPVLETARGDRLPAVPVHEAHRLNVLKDEMEGRDSSARAEETTPAVRHAKDGSVHGVPHNLTPGVMSKTIVEAKHLGDSLPPTKTNPLFPPLPLYGPPSLLRAVQCYFFRLSSAILSFCFLMVIVLGAIFTSVIPTLKRLMMRMVGKNPLERRPFYQEECRRRKARLEEERMWQQRGSPAALLHSETTDTFSDSEGAPPSQEYVPLAGGPDPLVRDAQHYAQREGLDLEEFRVQTEDGFIVKLWHLYNPRESYPTRPDLRRARSANVFRDHPVSEHESQSTSSAQFPDGTRRYPVLLMHGLLQSAGAYCCTGDNSLALYLAKSGYDVWLGNNRCGFEPEHVLLNYGDPRMWAWNIRQMGVMDLTAFISRVLEETQFEKLGLVCHSQGTTQTLVALAKEQRPDIGEKISVFCALAPAAYAGPLIKKMYFKFMQVITPGMFRVLFGIHAFIPFMLTMHSILPGRLYGAMGYLVFSFLFNWTDDRWEQDLRDRLFQFSPVYVSSESMRWWLGRECFAKQKCILSTRDEAKIEDEEDMEEDQAEAGIYEPCASPGHSHGDQGRYSWFDERAPPFAFWVAGNDQLVDGRRLLRRFERGREPYVDVVHSKIIDNYEHLDVIWAVNSIETVGSEVKQVIWKTAPAGARATCRTPDGCQNIEIWNSSRKETESATTATIDENST